MVINYCKRTLVHTLYMYMKIHVPSMLYMYMYDKIILFREFGYISRTSTSERHVCHVFRCDIAAMGLVQAMLDSHDSHTKSTIGESKRNTATFGKTCPFGILIVAGILVYWLSSVVSTLLSLSVCLCVSQSVSVCLFHCLSVCLYLSVRLSLSLSLSVSFTVCVCLSVCLSLFLSVCLSVYLSVCLFHCLCLSL